MPFVFSCSVTRNKDGFSDHSSVTVSQLTESGQQVAVAHIQDDYDCGGIRDTRISHAGGTLQVSVDYDMPLVEHDIIPFRDEQNQDSVKLHHINRPIPGIPKEYPQDYLEAENRFYPLIQDAKPGDPNFCFTVFEAAPEKREDGLLFPTLAVVSGEQTKENWTYTVALHRAAPISLCMAIFSLPFMTA